MSIPKRIFPFLRWFDGYDRAMLRIDFISGLTVALVLVPQSMAYAQLAGLPPYYGLYAAFLPPMVASLFGSSRQLATGPVAVVSLMTSASLEPLATAGSAPFVAYALLLALMVGLFQFGLGVLRLGVVINFLSHPVVNGFTNAAALIIATSQLSKIFGVSVENATHHYETVFRVIESAVHYTHWPTVGMAAISFATMIILRRINRRTPNVLVAVVVTVVLSWAVGFERNETVDIRQFEAPRVAEVVGLFNEAVEINATLESYRATSWKERQQLQAEGDNGICLRCHGSREVSQFEQQRDSGDMWNPSSGKVLFLHEVAGLLGGHSTELKESASRYRADLRNMLFVKAEDSERRPRFYLRGEAPPDVPLQAGTWRLKVGNGTLNPNALVMSGGGAVVGTIPAGLPGIRVPRVDWHVVPHLAVAAVIISLLGFMEAISISKAIAARTQQKLDPNQELIGQGLANILGCMGQSYAVSGSFSRSAVNMQAGAQTGLSNVFSGAFVVVVLLFFTKGLYHLPQAVLASIIMMAVIGLINVGGFAHAWRTNRFDGAVSAISFAGTLVFAPHLEWGIFMGVALSIGAYLFRSMRPQVTELAPHPDGTMRDTELLGLKKCRHIAVVSFEGPLNFASANYLESEILNRVSGLSGLRHVLIAGNGISEVDASGEETLRHILRNLRDAGYAVSFAGLPEKVLDVLRRSRLYERIGTENFYGTLDQAIAMIFPSTHMADEEADCPYRKAMPRVVELSLHPDGSLRNAFRHGLAKCRHIAIFRFDAPLRFANIALLEQEVLNRLTDRPGVRHLVLVCHGISDMDDTGAKRLGQLVRMFRADGLAVSFSGLKEEALEVLERNHVAEVLGHENMYPTQNVAIAAIYGRSHTGSSETECPLRSLAPRLTELSLDSQGFLRDARKHNLTLCRHIGVLRFEGQLVLYNQRAIQTEFIRWAKTRPGARNVVFLANKLDNLDRNEVENLVTLVEEVGDAGYRVVLAGLSEQAAEELAQARFADRIGRGSLFPTDTLAIAAIMLDAHASDTNEDCPLQDLLPRLTELSLHPDGSLRDAHRHALALCQRIAAVRFDGPLNFATIRYFARKLRGVLARRHTVTHVLIAGHTLAGVDSIAAEEFRELSAKLRSEGYFVAVSGLKDEDLEVLTGAGEDNTVGVNAVYPTQAAAIESIYAAAHQDSDEPACPLVEVVPAP